MSTLTGYTAGLLRTLLIATCCWLPWLSSSLLPAHAQNSTPDNPLTIRYCIDPDWMPYEAIRDGVHIGISADYLALIAEKSGLKFQLVPTTSWTETLQYLQNGDCQMSPMLNLSPEREGYLAFTKVYFRSPNVLVSLKQQPFLQSMDNIGHRSLAVPAGYRLIEHIQRNYPDIAIKLVENEPDGLHAVADGTADLFIGSLYSINNQIQQDGLYQLKVAGWLGLEDELRMGVSINNTELIPLLNAALDNITEDEHVAIYKKWTRIKVIDVTNYQLVGQLGILALVIILLLAVWNYRSRNFNRQLTEKNLQLEQSRQELQSAIQELEFLSHHDPLTALYNRNHFEKTLQLTKRKVKQKNDVFSMVVIDIDYFKHINDQYGHCVGDEVLRELAQIILTEVREHDQVTRWGGEEFVILCQRTNAAETKALCERITVAIRQHTFHSGINLSCSFGVAEQMPDEDILQCFERADKALYQAKQTGRNRICLA